MDELDKQYILNSYHYLMQPIRLHEGKMYMWFSICSVHQGHDPKCMTCQAGSWHEIALVEHDEDE